MCVLFAILLVEYANKRFVLVVLEVRSGNDSECS